MTIIGLIIVLVIIGVCLHLLTKYIPMDSVIIVVIRVIIVLACVVLLLEFVGINTGLNLKWGK